MLSVILCSTQLAGGAGPCEWASGGVWGPMRRRADNPAVTSRLDRTRSLPVGYDGPQSRYRALHWCRSRALIPDGAPTCVRSASPAATAAMTARDPVTS